MIHKNYLTDRELITSKTGKQFNYFNANSHTQAGLYNLGYRYYYKKELGYFGKNMLLKLLHTKIIQGEVYCVCVNTINFEYLIKPEDLILNQY